MSSKRKFELNSQMVTVQPEHDELQPIATPSVVIDIKKKEKTTFTIAVDTDFKIKVKAWCAHKQLDLKDAFFIAMEEYISRNPV